VKKALGIENPRKPPGCVMAVSPAPTGPSHATFGTRPNVGRKRVLGVILLSALEVNIYENHRMGCSGGTPEGNRHNGKNYRPWNKVMDALTKA